MLEISAKEVKEEDNYLKKKRNKKKVENLQNEKEQFDNLKNKFGI